MSPVTRGAGAQWSGYTSDALKKAKLLVKLKFTEEASKSIVGNIIDSREELENLDDDMCKSFLQSCRNPGDEQKGVAIYTMSEVFLKILVWGLQHMKRVFRNIDINTIEIEWFRGMNKQKKLEADWQNTLSEKDYPKANLIDVPPTFEGIIALLRNICGPLGIFLVYFVR